MKTTYWKTVIQVEVLSENEPIQADMRLKDIDAAITDGDCSGLVEIIEITELSAKEAARALIEQGSDPSFFMLDKNGKRLDWRDI